MLSDQLAKRLQKFYSSYHHEMPYGDNEIWCLNNTASSQSRSSVHDILLNGNTNQVISLLSTPQETDLFYGMDNTAISIKNRKQISNLDLPKNLSSYLQRSLIELGILKMPKKGIITIPKSDEGCINLIARLVKGAHNKMNNSYCIAFPKGFNDESNSIEITNNEHLSFRAINAMVHSIKSIVLLNSFDCNSVIEIGPGTGRTLLNLYKSGMQCAGIDIPLSIIGQALFFAETLGEDCFLIPGEEDITLTSKNRIRLCVPSEASKYIPQYHLTLNVDSFTEIDSLTAANYASLISKHSYLFLSINHETNKNTTSDYFRQNKKLPAIRTHSIWRGYVEEFFINVANSPFSASAA